MKLIQRPQSSRRFRSSALTFVLFFAAFLLSGYESAQAQGWASRGVLNIPQHQYNFLAATPTGDLLAATFHSGAPGASPRPLPALLIRNAQSAEPQVSVLCEVTFENQRGYSGITCDPVSGFYVTGDTGETSTSFIRKFKFDGTPDTSFGNGGELRPNRRCLGVDVIGEYLFVAVDWGEVMVLRSSNGAQLGMLPRIQGAFIRDITIDPKSMRVFGVAEGALYTWGGGAPWNPTAYMPRQLTQKAGELRSGEGIAFDPIKRTLLNTPIPGNTLMEMEGSGRINRYPVVGAREDSHLADTIMSFDGSTLYVSDMKLRQIHVMQRDMSQLIATNTASTRQYSSTTAAGETHGSDTERAAPVTWSQSYTEIVQQARQQGKPMVVYFRTGEFKGCLDFEESVLLTDPYNRRAQNYINVFEDVSRDRLLAYRFGVFRVPHLVILDKNGETKAEFSGQIDPAQVFGALEQYR